MKNTKCLEMQSRAKKIIPGMTQLLSKRPDMFAPGVWPGYYTKAKGSIIWDLDGNEYIDMSIGGIGANVLGYADPDVNAAVERAIHDGSSSSLNCPEEVELAELLCGIHSWADMVRFARTGGEAMAIAVRIARAHTGHDKIAFCGYHGWHDWYLAANLYEDNALGEHLIPGLEPRGVPKALAGTAFPFRYNQLDELKEIVKKHKNELGVIVLETIRSAQPEPGFLEGVREIANQTGAVLILDEISSGFRMNSGGAHLLFNLIPDIAVFSKALGNGYPIAAVIGKKTVMEVAQKTFISSTMWSERIGPVAALATLKKHAKFNVGEHLMAVGTRIQEGWRKLAQKHGIEITVGGIPPLSHFAFQSERALELKALFVKLMLEKGFLASNQFYAMFAHKEDHIADYLRAIDEVFSVIFSSDQSKIEINSSSKGFSRLT